MWLLVFIASAIFDILLIVINLFSSSSANSSYLLFNLIITVVDFFWITNI